VLFVKYDVVDDTGGDWFLGLLVSFMFGFVCWGLWSLTLACTTGVGAGFGQGEAQGYINHSGTYGVIWKTNEYSMQLENDKQAVLSELRFSAPSESVKQELDTLMGTRVKVTYAQWWMMPYKFGETNVEAVKVERSP